MNSSESNLLTKEIAELWNEFWENSNQFTTIEDAAAEILSQHEEFLSLGGLTSLSDAAAESLSKHEGELFLKGLTSLSNQPGHLALASKLSQDQVHLWLTGLTSLSDAAAERLGKHRGELFLDGLTSLSDVAAEALSRPRGWFLSLDGLTSVSDAAAESLSTYIGKLSLKGLTSLSDAALWSLAGHRNVSLNGVMHERLEPLKQLKQLSLKQSLIESGVLTKEVAVRWDVCWENSDQVTTIEDAAAKILSILSRREEGAFPLNLNSLTSLSDAAAESLGKHEGELYLKGLTSLSDAALWSLAGHQNVSINGVMHERLKQLYQSLVKRGVLTKKLAVRWWALSWYSNHFITIEDAAAEVLSLVQDEGDLELNGLTSLSDAAAESLSKHRGGLG